MNKAQEIEQEVHSILGRNLPVTLGVLMSAIHSTGKMEANVYDNGIATIYRYNKEWKIARGWLKWEFMVNDREATIYEQDVHTVDTIHKTMFCEWVENEADKESTKS